MKTLQFLSISFIALLFFSCNKSSDVPIPSAGPNSIMKETFPLLPESKLIMEGVYQVTSGADFFGDQVVNVV